MVSGVFEISQREFQRSFKGVLSVFQGSFKGAPSKFLGCSKEVSRVFQESSSKEVSRIFERSVKVVKVKVNPKEVSKVFQVCFKGVPSKF